MKYDEETADIICELLNDNIPRTRLEIEAELGVKSIENELHHLVFCDDLQKYVRRSTNTFQYAPNHYQNEIIGVRENGKLIGCHRPYPFDGKVYY